MITPAVLLRRSPAPLVLLLLAGCNSWVGHQETITYQAGDAIAWNRTIHTIDPWPVAARDTNIPASGRRIARAIDRYENGEPPSAAPMPMALVPMAPMAPGAAPH